MLKIPDDFNFLWGKMSRMKSSYIHVDLEQTTDKMIEAIGTYTQKTGFGNTVVNEPCTILLFKDGTFTYFLHGNEI